MSVFLFWGSYIAGIISGLLLSILIAILVKNNPYVVEKVKAKMFNKKAVVVDPVDPLDKFII